MDNNNSNKEIWKDVLGYEGLYQVSDKGNVRSLDRVVWDNRGYYKQLKGKLLALKNSNAGYPVVSLHGKEKPYKRYVHDLVVEAFIGKDDSGECINHINGIKTDNRAENLEWITYSENNSHAYKHNLKNNRGENQSRHKLKEKDVLEIRKIYEQGGHSHRSLAEDYGVTHSTIGNIIRRNIWTHI